MMCLSHFFLSLSQTFIHKSPFSIYLSLSSPIQAMPFLSWLSSSLFSLSSFSLFLSRPPKLQLFSESRALPSFPRVFIEKINSKSFLFFVLVCPPKISSALPTQFWPVWLKVVAPTQWGKFSRTLYWRWRRNIRVTLFDSNKLVRKKM